MILRGSQALPLYARVAEAGAPRAIVLPAAEHGQLQVQLRPGDISWRCFLGAVPAPQAVQAHVAAADDPAILLFSSGTTGEGLLWSAHGKVPVERCLQLVVCSPAALGIACEDARRGAPCHRFVQGSPRPFHGHTPPRCGVL